MTLPINKKNKELGTEWKHRGRMSNGNAAGTILDTVTEA